jgi:hypothetical protein
MGEMSKNNGRSRRHFLWTASALVASGFMTGCRKNDSPSDPSRPAGDERSSPAPSGDRPKGDRLAQPVPVEVDGKPLAREGGELFPLVGDLDGDGRQDLLLGTRTQEGRLLVYRNVGTNTNPRLSGPQWFDDTVPSGRIPKG